MHVCIDAHFVGLHFFKGTLGLSLSTAVDVGSARVASAVVPSENLIHLGFAA